MTSYKFLCFVTGIGLTGILVGLTVIILTGLIVVWKDKSKRNCDVGTPEEQYYRFEDYCAEHADLEGYDMCKGCPLENEHDCRIAWMNMPYKKEN